MLVRLAESDFSGLDVFTFRLLYKDILWTLCVAIFEGNASVKCILAQHKSGSFP
jgi:hypothetical protein